ncbi:MAG: ATP-binding cassette domain-containing protein, partial [Methanofollis sp.]|uniref:ATP-binding cassette domain-containing protein n=1 Tax=Methanofollis sp. TaxID=2052835 RepID=UPI00262F40C2
MSSELLRVEHLRKTYGHGDIFSDVSFTLEPGKTMGFFGMSGSGKSTLGRCILGLERPTRGSVWFEGTEVSGLKGKALARIRPGMQMIFQHPEVSLNPKWKLFDSVTEPLAFHQKREREEVFQDLMPLIRAVGLRREQFSRYPHQLSGGEIQRAMMVRIYSLAPRLIVADEPTSM